MKNLLEKNDFLRPAQLGRIVEGKIIGRTRSAIFLDLGILGVGIIFGKEFQEAKSELKDLKIDKTIFAKIIEPENEDGYVELSLSQASDELNWEKVCQKKEKEETIMVEISGANKGGLLADVFGIPAFLPVSQLLPEHYPKVEKGDTFKILKELQKFIGQELKVKIFDLDSRQNKLILSEKASMNGRIKEILKDYKIGDIVDGEITGITDFGVFVKFPIPTKASPEKTQETIEGLIHISELDWRLIGNPSEIVKPGEKVKAKIISIANDKVSLSMKALKQDPWKDIEKKYKKGDIVKGKVTKFNPYGVFVQITSEIQGLCHVSEFNARTKMEEILKIGKKYDFEILQIEPKEHKMSLGLS